MKKFKRLTILDLFILFVLWVFILPSCKKSDSKSNSNTDTTVYTFSDPQFVASQNQPLVFGQISSIQSNIIVTGAYATRNSSSYTEVKWALNKNGTTGTIDLYLADVPNGRGYPAIDAYAITKTGDYMYVTVNKVLYKVSTTLHTGGAANNYTMVCTNFGTANCIKVFDGGGIIISSDTNNGSLLKIDDAGNITSIASNLGNPGSFDIYNNEYYVVQNTSSGYVAKISSSGSKSSIVSNISYPSGVAVGANGNIVVENLRTINGTTFRAFAIYSSKGEKISDVTDKDGLLITSERPLSNITLNTPIFIDSFNNLFFSTFLVSAPAATVHSDDLNNLDNTGIWSVQMTEK